MGRSLTAALIGAGSLVISACGTSAPSVTATTRPSQTTTTTPNLSSPVVTASQFHQGSGLAESFGLVGLVKPRTVGQVELELSTDFTHWQNITPPVPDQGQYGGSATIKDVCFLSPSVGWVVVGLPTGTLELYRTNNGGMSWQDEGGASGGSAGDELVDFVDPSHGWREVIAPTAGAISFGSSDDGGETWTPVTNPARWPSSGVLSFSDVNHGYVANTLPPNEDLPSSQPIADFSPLWETADGGQMWNQATIALPPNLAGAENYDGLPTFSSADDGVLPVVIFHQGTVSVAFYITSNAGQSWSYQSFVSLGSTTDTGASLYDQLPSVAVAGPSTWWVVSAIRPNGSAKVRVTDNGGQSWTTVSPSGFPSTFSATFPIGVAPLQATSSTNAWLMMENGPGCGLYGTTDGGKTWMAVCPG